MCVWCMVFNVCLLVVLTEVHEAETGSGCEVAPQYGNGNNRRWLHQGKLQGYCYTQGKLCAQGKRERPWRHHYDVSRADSAQGQRQRPAISTSRQ